MIVCNTMYYFTIFTSIDLLYLTFIFLLIQYILIHFNIRDKIFIFKNFFHRGAHIQKCFIILLFRRLSKFKVLIPSWLYNNSWRHYILKKIIIFLGIRFTNDWLVEKVKKLEHVT